MNSDEMFDKIAGLAASTLAYVYCIYGFVLAVVGFSVGSDEPIVEALAFSGASLLFVGAIGLGRLAWRLTRK